MKTNGTFWLMYPLDPILHEDYDSSQDYDKDSNQDSNQDSNEDDFVEDNSKEKCGYFIDFDECVAKQTMDALKNVIIWKG